MISSQKVTFFFNDKKLNSASKLMVQHNWKMFIKSILA